jgi:hypothetical protein
MFGQIHETVNQLLEALTRTGENSQESEGLILIDFSADDSGRRSSKLNDH